MTLTDHIEQHAHKSDRRGDLWKETIKEVETGLIRGALKRSGGNISKAAAILGITRATFYQRMNEFGMVAK